MPGATSSFLLLVGMPFATNSILATMPGSPLQTICMGKFFLHIPSRSPSSEGSSRSQVLCFSQPEINGSMCKMYCFFEAYRSCCFCFLLLSGLCSFILWLLMFLAPTIDAAHLCMNGSAHLLFVRIQVTLTKCDQCSSKFNATALTSTPCDCFSFQVCGLVESHTPAIVAGPCSLHPCSSALGHVDD